MYLVSNVDRSIQYFCNVPFLWISISGFQTIRIVLWITWWAPFTILCLISLISALCMCVCVHNVMSIHIKSKQNPISMREDRSVARSMSMFRLLPRPHRSIISSTVHGFLCKTKGWKYANSSFYSAIHSFCIHFPCLSKLRSRSGNTICFETVGYHHGTSISTRTNHWGNRTVHKENTGPTM